MLNLSKVKKAISTANCSESCVKDGFLYNSKVTYHSCEMRRTFICGLE